MGLLKMPDNCNGWFSAEDEDFALIARTTIGSFENRSVLIQDLPYRMARLAIEFIEMRIPPAVGWDQGFDWADDEHIQELFCDEYLKEFISFIRSDILTNYGDTDTRSK